MKKTIISVWLIVALLFSCCASAQMEGNTPQEKLDYGIHLLEMYLAGTSELVTLDDVAAQFASVGAYGNARGFTMYTEYLRCIEAAKFNEAKTWEKMLQMNKEFSAYITTESFKAQYVGICSVEQLIFYGQARSMEHEGKLYEAMNAYAEIMNIYDAMYRCLDLANQLNAVPGDTPTPAPTPVPTPTPTVKEVVFSGMVGNTEITSFVIPDGVTRIDDYAFFGCTKLKNVTIPDSVTSIGDFAFAYCDSLTSITIPASVTSIGEHAVYYCDGLTSVTIPDSVVEMGDGAFANNPSLTQINISPDHHLLLVENGLLINKKEKRVISCLEGAAEYTIPQGITAIGASAFDGCSSLTNIVLPDSVTGIGGSAFFQCDALTSITIPASVTSIGVGAFAYCRNLTSIAIPDGVTSIGKHAFQDCDSLTSITISASVTSIGDGAFEDCDSLTSVTIPRRFEKDIDRIFVDCPSLTNINYY